MKYSECMERGGGEAGTMGRWVGGVGEGGEVKEKRGHRVYRVPGFLTSRPNGDLHSLTHKRVLFRPLWVPGGRHSIVGGGGGTQFDDGTDTLLL